MVQQVDAKPVMQPRKGPRLLWSLVRGIGLLRESRIGMIGFGLVLFWALVAIFAPLIAPLSPTATIQPFAPPGTVTAAGDTLWLGADQLGRDVLSRVIYGSRTVLFYAPVATFCAYFIGCIFGLLAGYLGGRIDDLLNRISDIILAFPVLVLYVVIIVLIGPSGLNIILAVTFASAPGIMRIVRGLTLELRNRDYIAAAQTSGASLPWILFVELLPNARGPLIVDACLRMGYVIITIGVLGFLGLGLPPPTPDWGSMVAESRAMITFAPWMAVVPAIAISSLVLGFNLLADGLREISLRD